MNTFCRYIPAFNPYLQNPRSFSPIHAVPKMAATIVRSISAVRLSGAGAASRRLFTSTVSSPPPLPGLARPRISILRSAAPAISHSLHIVSPCSVRVNSVRCRVNRSGSAYSPLNSGSNFGDRPPTEMAPLFPGCDYEHWLIVMDKPGGEGATKQQMIDCYIQTLAKVLGRFVFVAINLFSFRY